jgi:WD40 repeat protein
MKNHSAIKSVWEHPKTGNILVGTRSGEIIELGVFDDEKPNIFLKSHHNQEIWGLEVNPIKKEFVTVGQDGMLGVWDIEKHRQT